MTVKKLSAYFRNQVVYSFDIDSPPWRDVKSLRCNITAFRFFTRDSEPGQTNQRNYVGPKNKRPLLSQIDGLMFPHFLPSQENLCELLRVSLHKLCLKVIPSIAHLLNSESAIHKLQVCRIFKAFRFHSGTNWLEFMAWLQVHTRFYQAAFLHVRGTNTTKEYVTQE